VDNLNFTIFDVVRGLLRNWFTVAKSVFGVSFLVMLITILVPKTYSSKSKLLVNLGRENVAVDPSASIGGSGVLAMPLNREAEINSVAEMMTNNQLFYKVVQEIGPEYILEKKTFKLDQWLQEKEDAKKSNESSHLKAEENSEAANPSKAEEAEDSTESVKEEAKEVVAKKDQNDQEETAPGFVDKVMGTLQDVGVLSKVPFLEKGVIAFRKNLMIEPIERSNIVSVEYECHDPQLAKLVVQTFVDQYKKLHSDVHRPTGSFDFLTREMKRVEKELQQKNKKFESFKRKTGLLDIVQQKSGLITRLQKAEEEADVVGTEINVLAEEIRVIQENLKSIKKLEVQEQIKGAGNRAIDQLQIQLADFYRQLELARKTGTRNSGARVSSLEAKIKRQKATIAELQEQSETRMGANKVYTDAKSNLEVKKPRLAALEEKKKRLAAKIDEISGLLKLFTEDEKEFEKLQVDVLLATQAYKTVTSNLQQAKIDRGRQQDGISNISQPQAPSVNHKPVSPNKLLNLLGGIFFGGILGCGLAVLKEYKRVSQESQNPNTEPATEASTSPANSESVVVGNSQVPSYSQENGGSATQNENRVPVHQGATGTTEMDEDLRERPAEWTTESEG